MAYSLDLKGSEYYTIYIRDLTLGKNVKDIIENTSGGITWSLDSKSFFYSKLDKFHRPRQIYKHVLALQLQMINLYLKNKMKLLPVVSVLPQMKNFLSFQLQIILQLKNIFFLLLVKK